jgi:lipopolysaccharide transport system ATP-binding protein
MSNVAIRVENLGKQFQIGASQAPYRTIRETINDLVASPFRRLGRVLRGDGYGASELNETIWALRDVSFEVQHGEVLGIIGHNGAGKSTLLKILSRITEPSEGFVDIYGRVGALLEVGTGFHPELTGRENVYLNAAILGMKRQEIDRKFDEIVDFAGVEKFIDTPVKHYSSGMGLRLGFAVAAHLEPEILVVDEVLAVGDAAFQKKCLGKMSEVAGEGRTVLFVSHNMGAVESLCKTGLLLKKGTMVGYGNVTSIITQYATTYSQDDSNPLLGNIPSKQEPIVLTNWGIGSPHDSNRPQFFVGGDVSLWFSWCANAPQHDVLLSIGWRDIYNNLVLVSHNKLESKNFSTSKNEGYFQVILKNINLRPDIYYLHYELYSNDQLMGGSTLGQVEIVPTPFYTNGVVMDRFPSVALFRSEWTLIE